MYDSGITDFDSGAWNQFLGDKSLTSVVMSTDGKRIAALDKNGTGGNGFVHFSANSGREWISFSDTRNGTFSSIALSPDGSTLGATDGNSLFIFDVSAATSAEILASITPQTVNGTGNTIENLSFSKDGSTAVFISTVTENGSASRWINRCVKKSGTYSCGFAQIASGDYSFLKCAFSEDTLTGGAVVSSGSNLSLIIFKNSENDTEESSVIFPLSKDSSDLSKVCESIVISADGTKIAVATQYAIDVFASSSGTAWKKYKTELSYCTSLAISSDGSILAAAVSGEKTLKITSGNYIHISTNGGSAFTPFTPAGASDWRKITLSEDGNRFSAVKYVRVRNDDTSYNEKRIVYSSVDSVSLQIEAKDILDSAETTSDSIISSSADGYFTAAISSEKLFLRAINTMSNEVLSLLPRSILDAYPETHSTVEPERPVIGKLWELWRGHMDEVDEATEKFRSYHVPALSGGEILDKIGDIVHYERTDSDDDEHYRYLISIAFKKAISDGSILTITEICKAIFGERIKEVRDITTTEEARYTNKDGSIMDPYAMYLDGSWYLDGTYYLHGSPFQPAFFEVILDMSASASSSASTDYISKILSQIKPAGVKFRIRNLTESEK